MEKEEALKRGEEIQATMGRYPYGFAAAAKHLIKSYAGQNNSFYLDLTNIPENRQLDTQRNIALHIFGSFLSAVETDLISQKDVEYQIRNDIESELLLQATIILDNKNYHPATGAMIIGAVLEEFLKNFAERSGLNNENSKPSINTYASFLKKEDKITKQDFKDITSWAGIRNDAAHGRWEEVNDKPRIKIMLESVNLFLRKYNS